VTQNAAAEEVKKKKEIRVLQKEKEEIKRNRRIAKRRFEVAKSKGVFATALSKCIGTE